MQSHCGRFEPMSWPSGAAASALSSQTNNTPYSFSHGTGQPSDNPQISKKTCKGSDTRPCLSFRQPPLVETPQSVCQWTVGSLGSLPSFPGFMMPFGSRAFLTAAIMSNTTGPCSCLRKGILPWPTPCSPVQVPPTSHAACTTSETTCKPVDWQP